MSDIVERLRLDAEPTESDMEEAATEIERLRARVALLEVNLRKLIEFDGTWNEVNAAVDAARAALEAKP